MVAENRNAPAREVFRRFKTGLEQDRALLNELLNSFRLLLTERSTTYDENRFIVGGAVEHIMAAAMRCVGLNNVEVVGFEEYRVDIRVQGREFSVKSQFAEAA